MEIWTLNAEEFSEAATNSKNLFLSKMLNDGAITQEQYDHYAHDFAIIIAKPSLFGRIFKSNKHKYIVVEQHSSLNDHEDENDNGGRKALKLVRPEDKKDG